MSLDVWQLGVVILFQLVNGAASVWTWVYVRYGDRNTVIDRRFSALETDMAGVKAKQAAAPTHADVSAIREILHQTARENAALAGELKGVNENLRLVLSRLTERGAA